MNTKIISKKCILGAIQYFDSKIYQFLNSLPHLIFEQILTLNSLEVAVYNVFILKEGSNTAKMLANILVPFLLGFDVKNVGKMLARCWSTISIRFDIIGEHLANIVM